MQHVICGMCGVCPYPHSLQYLVAQFDTLVSPRHCFLSDVLQYLDQLALYWYEYDDDSYACQAA